MPPAHDDSIISGGAARLPLPATAKWPQGVFGAEATAWAVFFPATAPRESP